MCVVWTAKDTKHLHADIQNRSDRLDAQSDLSLCWAQILKGTFSHCVVQIHMDI